MPLVNTGKVDDAPAMLDIAFRSARQRRDFTHKDIKGRKDISRLDKSKRAEKQRIQATSRSLHRQLSTVLNAFPSFDRLAPFYKELVQTVVDTDDLKQSLGAVQWAADKINALGKEHALKVDRCEDIDKINPIRRAFYGRCASTLRQVNKHLKKLDQVRKVLKELPTIKTSLFTVVIAGVPNVGKSTLIKALTGAQPRIKAYAFTTKKLNLGYKEIDGKKVQFVDTPGVLDRTKSKRNKVEQRAALAMQHLADIILFVIDPTSRCGYSISQQQHLLEDMRKEFHMPFIVVVNKADVATPDELKKVQGIRVVAAKQKGVDAIKDIIKKNL